MANVFSLVELKNFLSIVEKFKDSDCDDFFIGTDGKKLLIVEIGGDGLQYSIDCAVSDIEGFSEVNKSQLLRIIKVLSDVENQPLKIEFGENHIILHIWV
jgi:hypothetical protein